MKEWLDQNKLRGYIEKAELKHIFNVNIEANCRLFYFEKGDLICQKDREIRYVYFLVEGKTKIFVDQPNGKSYLLRTEEAISLYGDIEAFERDSYTANVEALSDCFCIAIPIRYIRNNFRQHPPYLKYMCHTLSYRLRTISQMSAANLLHPLKNKVAGYLMLYKDNDSNEISLPNSYSDISDNLGTTYRHLSRTLRQMEEEGIIHKDNKVIRILDLEKLLQLGKDIYTV